MTDVLLTGSFFDLVHVNPFDAAYWTDTCRFWGEANWRALIADMNGIGIDTAICGSCAYWGRPIFPRYEKTVGLPLKMGCPDPLAVIVDEADRRGMKLFFGIGFRGRCSQIRDYAGMEKPWPEVWFKWNTAMAQALVELYSKRPCFGGLYISYEIDFRDLDTELYEKLIREYLRPVVGKVKLLASPGALGVEVKDYDHLVRQIERTNIDILAPQDYGGRSGDIPTALGFARANAEGLERIAKPLAGLGVQLWSNCELFDFEATPDGRAACVPGPFERIRQQMVLQAPFAQKLVCYQYQGLMNRRTDLVNVGAPGTQKLYDQYQTYRQSLLKAP